MTLSYAGNVGQNILQGISVIGDENSTNYLMCLLTKTEAFRNKVSEVTSEKFGCFDGSRPKAQVACLDSVLGWKGRGSW